MIEEEARYIFARLSSHVLSKWALTASIGWLSWYLWKFTIAPVLKHNEPRSLPYYVPCELFAISCHLKYADLIFEVLGAMLLRCLAYDSDGFFKVTR